MSLGTDIKRRRDAFQLSEQEVAQWAHIDVAALNEIEADSRVPSTWELDAICSALACNPASLLSGGQEDARRSVARFRSGQAAKGLTGVDLRLLARGAEVGRILADLKARLGEPASAISSQRRVCAPSKSKEAWEDGYELGAAARAALFPQGAIPSIQEQFETWGVHVAEVKFEGHIDAASLYETGAFPVVLLNSASPRVAHPLAKRAILSHELCHLLHDGGQRDVTVVSLQQDDSAIERRANAFAPSFIAPRELVTSNAKIGKKKPDALVRDLATTWGLSFEGAAWHAKNLKLIDPRTAEKLAAGSKASIPNEFEARVPRTSPDQLGLEVEPSSLARGLLSETAIIAFAEGVISRQRAAEILSIR